MKVLRQILLLTAIMVGFSFSALAQRQDDKKNPPPKQDPPKIRVEEKKTTDRKKINQRMTEKNRIWLLSEFQTKTKSSKKFFLVYSKM